MNNEQLKNLYYTIATTFRIFAVIFMIITAYENKNPNIILIAGVSISCSIISAVWSLKAINIKKDE